MFVLDTNVLSELMRANPDPGVMQRIGSLPPAHTFITTITSAEILYGLDEMPEGERKILLISAAAELLHSDFSGRILSFDTPAAVEYASIVGTRRRSGRPIAMADAIIAAICRSRDAELLTRNTRDFGATGIRLSNPFIAE
ncbi:type II toxin-antitoxin system VapC family toxin [Spirochaeta africana]|uniref:Ribonuclease VapC n=1 Tax=Spirochaeta africana (strain ATCC 700263 / DSM 8902 / Z-7692) TaxID=889378 RepID=H9UG99_SPIAZ|nr:type II toxin-antitoxin system VapC family toxin [Spirochaeta africana]AFG36542.1 putative nucleic acid-binding protein, contains PIN domain [Spirochaeta africana DSM 8902]